ncbi:MAG: hypothetical protein ACI9I0_002173 [Rhodoferax sp.]|jgi:hypothetical protein
MRSIFRFILRVILLLAGLVFLASLLVAAMVLLAVWLLQALWAKLTGQPVRPWTFQMNRQAMWNRFYRAQGQAPRPGEGQGQERPTRRDDSNVIDVEPRDVKPRDE